MEFQKLMMEIYLLNEFKLGTKTVEATSVECLMKLMIVLLLELYQ